MKSNCCEKCYSPEINDNINFRVAVCRNPICPCHKSAEKKCSECQFGESHSQGCSKYKRATDTAENKSIISLEGWESVKLSLEAPTDESWEETLQDKLDYHGYMVSQVAIDYIKSFIASLLKRKERDIMKRYGIKEDRE